jgi:hypothetical protein
MPPRTALGQYLRARRELVRPEDVKLRPVGRRRVPGLRREELAITPEREAAAGPVRACEGMHAQIVRKPTVLGLL